MYNKSLFKCETLRLIPETRSMQNGQMRFSSGIDKNSRVQNQGGFQGKLSSDSTERQDEGMAKRAKSVAQQGKGHGVPGKHGKLCAGREFQRTMLGDVSGISAVKNEPQGQKLAAVTLTRAGCGRKLLILQERASTLTNLLPINCGERGRSPGTDSIYLCVLYFHQSD